MAGDKGFSPRAEVREALEKVVATLAIPRRLADFADELLVRWQCFRAGIEGTISALKRVFRLFRCFFRGFKGFASAVGLSVFFDNAFRVVGTPVADHYYLIVRILSLQI